MTNKNLDISIVLFNSLKWLDSFFNSLENQKFPLDKIRLLIRNNLNDSKDIEWIDDYFREKKHLYADAIFESGDNIGFGQGHNSNLVRAKSPFFLVTNVDLTFEKETLTTLLGEALRDVEEVAQWECRQKPFEHPKHYNPVTGDTAWCSSACALFRTSALQAVNGYEPRLFMYGEDVELSYRLRDHGYRLRYIPKATVWHYTYEEAAQVKPMQFLGSTYANVLLRCRFGSKRQVLSGFSMYLGLLALPQQFPGQRKRIFKNLFKLLKAAPVFLKSRKKSDQSFEFRMWDYEMIREGAFYQYTDADQVISAEMPLVSVLMRTTPNKNGRLKEAIASVEAQTYPRIHLVIVEDGGETSQQTVQQLEARASLEKVTYLPLPKGGRCMAGNAALEAAQGDLCCFLDDDDLFYADHLEVLVNAWLSNKSLGAVYGWAYQVRTEVISAEPWVYKEVDHSLIYRQPFSRYLMWHHNYLPIQTVLFQRKLYKEYGGFDPELDNLEDWNLWVRYCLHHDFEMVPKVTSLYRVPAKIETAVDRQKMLDDYYAKAQEKHAQLRLELSPTQVLEAAEQLSRELYIRIVPTKKIRQYILKIPGVRWLYQPLRKVGNYMRRARANR